MPVFASLTPAARNAATVAVFAALHLCLFLPVRGWDHFYADEIAHYIQIIKYITADWAKPEALTTIPGFHAAVASVSRLLGVISGPDVRSVSFVFNALAPVAFFTAARRLAPQDAAIRTAQFYFLPTFFPFLFLIYTDAFSLGLVLLSVLLMAAGRPVAAGFLGIAAMMVRQSNVLWLVFIMGWGYAGQHGFSFDPTPIRSHFKKCWVFLLGIAMFAAFLLVNHGVSVTHKYYHPVGVYAGNVYFALFLFFVMFLPTHVPRFRKAAFEAKAAKRTALLLAGFFAVYFLTFTHFHPHNQDAYSFFFRNKILSAVSASALLKAAFFVPVALGALALAAARFERKADALLWPFAALFLLMHWMIEPRYSLVPFALFLLFRKRENRAIEAVQTAYLAAFSLGIYYMTFIRRWSFL